MTSRTSSGNQGPPDPAREAKQDARDLLWAVWSKCRPERQGSVNQTCFVISMCAESQLVDKSRRRFFPLTHAEDVDFLLPISVRFRLSETSTR